MEDLEELLDSLESAAGAAKGPLDDLLATVQSLKSGLGGLPGAANDATEGAGKLGTAGGRLADSLTSAGGAVGKVQSALAQLGPEGMAVAAALGALTIAVTATVGALLAMSAAAIQVVQQRAALLATFTALSSGAPAGQRTLEMVERLADKLPFATEQIGAWARSLMGAGITGRELESAVNAVAAATAIMGEQGGAAAEDLLKRLAAGGKGAADLAKSIAEGGGRANRMLATMGVTAADVAKQLGMTPEQMARARISAVDMGHAIERALQAKGAGPLEQMGQTFPAIFSRLKEGALSLFQDLGPAVQPFMKAVQDLFGQFGRGTSAMGGLRGVVTEVFGTIFKYATKAVQAVSDFVRANFTAANVGSTWASVKGAIATVVGYLGKAWEAIKPLVTSSLFITGLKAAFGALAIVLGVIVAALAATTIAMGAVWAAVSALGVVLWGVIGKVVGFVGSALSSLGNLASGALAAAEAFVMGLVQGIENGAAAVVAAVAGLASKALGAFRGVFQIHSPSAIMRAHGDEDIAGAAAMGVEEGAPKVERAMAKLGPTVGPAARGGASGKAAAAAGGGRSISLSFSGCTFGAGLTQASVDEMFRAAAEKLFGEEGASGPEPEPA